MANQSVALLGATMILVDDAKCLVYSYRALFLRDNDRSHHLLILYHTC